ncbi:MAG: 50S ribosomal protein L13 [Firmicutes bacterium]|nr:50S ribosomal protein L13 [Bacillota bacterium]
MQNRTFVAKPHEVERNWFVVDAKGKTLGRLATQIASILRGKHKPIYTPHVDTGDFVIVVNADQVRLTGNKLQDKMYYRHSGYPGGLKSISAGELLAKNPERLVRLAVWGMLPHNRLGRKMIRKLKIYAGPEHPHAAQQPEVLEL